ncbi:porin [Solilutibacter silvestris]|uniref:Gram-negative porin n=1 Tax=Solilutibacter silvestris TaxID=1645665 RepID=A0A2K1Q0Y4_9GAMM|nr:porin [Lysobacter silvestris]PNS08705.1 Gram-negative porin [Lysobacter silvestris]
MKASPLRLAILTALVAGAMVTSPAFAKTRKHHPQKSSQPAQAQPQAQQESQQIADLKAALEAQKQVAAEQQERLEALESKLNATVDVQRAVTENDAAEKKKEPKLKLGEGLSVQNDKDEVKLYGLLDMTLRSRTNANTQGNTLRDMTTGYLSGSRWGIQGKHKLGFDDGTMNAIYKLESEYLLRDGSLDTDNVLFNRDAWIGVESKTLGRVTLGRQNTLGRDFAEVYGIPFAKPQVELTEGGWSNTNVSKNGIYYLGGANGTRYNGAIVWKRTFGNLVGGAAYEIGGYNVDDNKLTGPSKFSYGAAEALALAYNGSNWTVAGEYNQSKIAMLTHSTWTVGGNVRFGAGFRINAGYYHYEAEQGAANAAGKRKDDNYTLSASYQPETSKFNYYLSWEGAKAKNAGYTSSGYTLAAFKDTSGVIRTGAGNRDAYAATVIYKVDKRVDFYVFSDYMKTRGGYNDPLTSGYHGTVEVGGGMRLRF